MLNYTQQIKISLGLPCYNEENNIEDVLEDCIKLLSSNFKFWEILVIDNNSEDNTYRIVNSIIEKYTNFHNKIKIIKNEKNLLYSGSIEKIQNQCKYDLIAIMDADNQYNPNDILKCINFMQENNCDIVFGIREKRKDGFFRDMVSYVFKSFMFFLIGSKLKDINCGLKIMKRYKKINFIKGLNHINPEIYANYKKDGKRIMEIEIEHKSRNFGQSVNTFFGIAKSFILIIKYLIKIRRKYNI
jgi:dolichol-phosphate mannosyltransferase